MLKLSNDLKKCRTDRPDEWTMDRFIRKAQEMEAVLEDISAWPMLSPEDGESARELARGVLLNKD